jgi:hypothetical protein
MDDGLGKKVLLVALYPGTGWNLFKKSSKTFPSFF